jgi:F-type H+-transporting ATPase subunit gamma
MSSLREIRQKLHSIENIKKITDAMERVAAVHLRRAQRKAEQGQPYIAKIKEILGKLAATDIDDPLFEQRLVRRTAVVVVAADKGLSGPYNSNIIAKADSFLEKYQMDAIEMFLIGRKAVEYYRRRPWKIAYEKINWGGKISYQEIILLSQRLVDAFQSGEYDEVWLIYTNYVSLIQRHVVVEKFLNVDKSAHRDAKGNGYLPEPDMPTVLAELLPRYCFTRLETALNQAFASELASRIVAMRAASKNSSDLIERLTLVRNKMRQAEITEEMIEISSGTEN